MKRGNNHRSGRKTALTAQSQEVETPHLTVEEDECPCTEYVLASAQRNMPALQEYLHELHTDGAFACR